MPKTIVVGLDGANYELVEKYTDEGELPNLERILSEGMTGDLESVLPPVTSPNWKAYSTGKNPGKIGIFWWLNVDTENRRVYLPSERYHENTEFWEIIGRSEPVGVMGMPTTFPPKSVDTSDSFVVAGAPDASNSGFAWPPAVEEELVDRFDYRVSRINRSEDEDEAAYEEELDLIDQRFRAAKHLFAEHDVSFLQVTTFYINSLHHHLWDSEYTRRGWKIIDEHLGDFLDEGHDIVLMSDHGHNEIHTVFRVNTWLQEQGYLRFDNQVADALRTVGVNSDRINRLVSTVDQRLTGIHVKDTLERLTPQWVINNLADEEGRMGRNKLENADWEHTDVVGSAQGPLYLNVTSEERYESLRAELIDRLESLTDPAGRPIAQEVFRGEELFHGKYADEAPDLVIDQASNVHISDKLGYDSAFSDTDEDWNGVNTRSGLFAAIGPSFGTGDIGTLSILDLAPTLLHLRGYAVPPDMDGVVRDDVFAPDSAAGTREVEYRNAAHPVRGDGSRSG